MLKKILTALGIAGLLTTGIVIGSSTLGIVFAQSGANGTLQDQASISTADAEAIALAANPGTTVYESDLEKENGVLIYSIELDNGLDVSVDATSGNILQTITDEQDNQSEAEDQDATENDADVEDQNENDEQQPQYSGSIQVNDQNQDVSEADEATALQSKATISATEAEAAAQAANPGTTVIKTELDNENGTLVYSVELSNGSDVKVDAGTAKILHTEAGGQDSEDGEQETAED